MQAPIRVAIAGFWHVHAGDYAREAVEHPETELVAVWDDDPALGRPGAERFGVEFVPTLDALLARADVDALTVTTETSRHHEVMTRAAAAGKHLFTEKILAPSVAEAESIVAATDAHDVRLVVSLPRLAHDYAIVLADLVDRGVLGRLVYARVRLSHDGAVARDGTPGWLPSRFFDPAPAIGGALTDLGCHPVYLTQRFLGASPRTIAATYTSATGRAVEDQAVVTLTYDGGAIGVIEAGFAAPGPFVVELAGLDGSVRYTDDQPVILGFGPAFGDGDAPHELALPEDRPDPFAQWVGHMRAGTRADDNIARAVELTRMVVAANRAAAAGRTLEYA
jgi:1,5-anhydro-D-fructose reductase (1,5-anhydro-D-mannitol-forming)